MAIRQELKLQGKAIDQNGLLQSRNSLFQEESESQGVEEISSLEKAGQKGQEVQEVMSKGTKQTVYIVAALLGGVVLGDILVTRRVIPPV